MGIAAMEVAQAESGAMRIAMLAIDVREARREYDKPELYWYAPQEALFSAVPQFRDIEMHIIACWQRPMSAPEKLAPNVWFHGLVVTKFGWLRTGYQGCIRAVRKKLSELQPNIVHGQGTERESGICAALSGFPNLITIHGNMRAIGRVLKARVGSFLWCAGLAEDFALKRTGGVFCNSAYTEAVVKPRTRRTWRVANPLREEFFANGIAAPPSDKCLLVNVGVISQRKRQLELLRLSRELRRKGLEFELHFIGLAPDGCPYARQFLEEIKPAEKDGYARYVGTRSGKELVEYFDRAQGMIHCPSEEAFGLVVAEALARNLKFFGSREGGIVDIASEVDGTELFAVDDWNDLAGRLERWMKAGYPRAQSAAEIMRERYRPAVIMRQHVEIYEQFLKESG
jgi:glycosyltransferase involved in cell wall biosynthesis